MSTCILPCRLFALDPPDCFMLTSSEAKDHLCALMRCAPTRKNYEREDIEALIRKLGGKPSGSVSKNAAFLIAGEKAGSKLDKARALGVRVITEDDFDRLIGKKP